jgi:hypothetical protein
MKQGRMLMPFALAALFALAAVPAMRVEAAGRKPVAATAAAAQRKGAALRQFSGTVTALDKGSLTVEKTGASAKSMVFTRSPEMKTSGELAKDARVTVWYRDEDGHPVARKVVVKAVSADIAR